MAAGLASIIKEAASITKLITLKTHTPQIWGVKIHPPNSGGECSEIPCFTVVFGVHSPNSGGEIFTPQIWGVWVFRVVCFRRSGPKIGLECETFLLHLCYDLFRAHRSIHNDY